jgi:hypothetical protein
MLKGVLQKKKVRYSSVDRGGQQMFVKATNVSLENVRNISYVMINRQ